MDILHSMKAVVLCAGYGTRLGSLTKEVPKPMLPLGGKPLLEHILAHLARNGIRKVAINLHFKAEQIREYFGTGERVNLDISYFDEPVLLGTAGAIRNMAGFLDGDDDFLIQYGDVLTDQDLSALYRFHSAKRAEVTFLLHKRSRSNSVVQMDGDGRILGFLERPSDDLRKTLDAPWVNSGICVCSPSFKEWIPESVPSDIPRDVIVPRVGSNRIYGFPLNAYRCAIDSQERYAEAELAIQEKRCFSES